MVTTTDGDNLLVVLVAEFAVVEVVEVNGALTADDADGVSWVRSQCSRNHRRFRATQAGLFM